ncbi:MAG TPA: class I SAM-dependent methyltransferase [Vicinamibacterales bacterium]|nr:class I SAM-dependent methyltransferase [Vicinamibacterales bacterium]
MDNLLDLTSRVEATHFWFRGFRRFVAPAIAEIAGPRRDLHLLDCGCGTGHNLATLLRPYGRAFGFDLTPGGLARARAAGFPLARADMAAIPFQSSRFDLVTSFDVMQYVRDDYAVVTEMARVLKPGGGLVVTAAALDVLRGGHAGTWPEVRRYTTTRMRSIVEDAGLEVRRLTYVFASLFPAMLAVRAMSRDTGQCRGGSSDPPPPDDWEMRVPAAPINAALTWMLSGEAALSRRIPMPVGSSVLVVARK